MMMVTECLKQKQTKKTQIKLSLYEINIHYNYCSGHKDESVMWSLSSNVELDLIKEIKY